MAESHPVSAAPESKNVWRTRLLYAVGLLAVAAIAFWAGRTTLKPAAIDAERSNASATIEVAEREFGRGQTVGTTVTMAKHAIGANMRAGTLTELTNQPAYKTGDTLYRVDQHPIRIAAGTVPMYRDLSAGAKGPDVQSLNAALAELGYAADAESNTFAAATTQAVRAWQQDLGIEQTGIVQRDELIIVPHLPTALSFDPETAFLGNQLAGGERFILGPSGEPQFTMELLPGQAALIPADATITVTFQDRQWPAVVSEKKASDDGNTINMLLTAPDGGVVCGQDCALLPPQEKQYLTAQVEVVKNQSGPAVPISALTSNPDGTSKVTVVTKAGDEERQVRVLLSQDGMALVEGLTVGDVVRVFNPAGGTAPGGSPPGGPGPGESQPGGGNSSTPSEPGGEPGSSDSAPPSGPAESPAAPSSPQS